MTESSKPTIAKNASDVAAVTAKKTFWSLGALEDDDPREVRVALRDGVQADEDDQQQARELDQGEYDVGLDALADAAEVDDRDQGHERQRDQHQAGSASVEAEVEAVVEEAGEGVAAVEAEVMPEHITVKATRNVTKWMPNALCV